MREKKNLLLRATIFGVSHSPWTQCALLACEAKGVKYELRADIFALPGWRDIVTQNGLILPTMVLSNECGGDVQYVVPGSFAIMQQLDNLFPDRFPLGLNGARSGRAEAQMRWHHGKLEELFFEGAFERFYPPLRKLWSFPLRFALQPSIFHQNRTCSSYMFHRLCNAACKGFLLVKFGSFLCAGAVASQLFGVPKICDEASTEAQLRYWEGIMTRGGGLLDEDKFSKGVPVLSPESATFRRRKGRQCSESGEGSNKKGPLLPPPGSAAQPRVSATFPRYLDLALFAQLQMVFTGLSPCLAKRVMERPRFVAFLQRMDRAFPTYAATNYCRAHPGLQQATAVATGTRSDALSSGEQPPPPQQQQQQQQLPRRSAPSKHAGGEVGGELLPLRHASTPEAITTLVVALFLVSPLGLPLTALFFAFDAFVRLRKPEASGRKLDPRSKWGQVFCALDLPVPDKARALLWREVKGLEKITQRRVWRWEAEVMCELGS